MGFFDASYHGTPPWDIGQPQDEIVRLAEAGEIKGSVLDVGCGTGENAMFLAGVGHEVVGVDAAPTAIRKAREKARQRKSTAKFLVHDALDLKRLGRTFDTVIDSGLYHTFSDEERERFVKGLESVLRPGGSYFVLCFSEKELGHGGPRRVTKEEIRHSFKNGWRIDYIREARFGSSSHANGPRAWLASITRR